MSLLCLEKSPKTITGDLARRYAPDGLATFLVDGCAELLLWQGCIFKAENHDLYDLKVRVAFAIALSPLEATGGSEPDNVVGKLSIV